MKHLLYFFLLISMISCAPQNKIIIDGESVTIYRPPGTVEIAENFYADETELTNIDYKEYLFWTKRTYGANSKEYQENLPDTTVWANQTIVNFGSLYLNLQIYNSYPVVGISLEQAKKYTDWRTERVTEMILLTKKHIKPNPNGTAENHFTIDRYLSGNYDWIIVKSDFVHVPRYKLPNSKEWERIAKGESSFQYGTDPSSKFNRNILKKHHHLYNTKEKFMYEKNKSVDQIELTIYSAKNTNGLFSMIGNVAELVEEGKTKGGSWKDSLEEISIESSQPFEQPNCWTGFRNICQWEIRKVDKSF